MTSLLEKTFNPLKFCETKATDRQIHVYIVLLTFSSLSTPRFLWYGKLLRFSPDRRFLHLFFCIISRSKLWSTWLVISSVYKRYGKMLHFLLKYLPSCLIYLLSRITTNMTEKGRIHKKKGSLNLFQVFVCISILVY